MSFYKFLLIIILAGLLLSNFAFAYTLSVPFSPEQPSDITGPRQYILTLYNFGLIFGALLAMLMIVIGGVQYTVSEAVGNKQDAMDRIKSAILGLVLLLAAFIILNTVNPQLPKLQEPELKEPKVTLLPPPPGAQIVQPPATEPSCFLGKTCSPNGSLCKYSDQNLVCKNGKWDLGSFSGPKL